MCWKREWTKKFIASVLLWPLQKFQGFQNVLLSYRRVKFLYSYYEGKLIVKDRWDLPHASFFKQAVGMKGSWILGYKFGTNWCCTLFNLLVCFDAEEKLRKCRYFHEYDYEFSQLKWSLIIHFSLSIFTKRNK